jgi:hypothetical protein
MFQVEVNLQLNKSYLLILISCYGWIQVVLVVKLDVIVLVVNLLLLVIKVEL